MKRYFPYFSILLFLCCSHPSNRPEKGKLRDLPSFKILSIDSSTYLTSESMSWNQAGIFMYFDPNCEHCIKQTNAFINSLNKLKNVEIYWITNESISAARSFSRTYHLDGISNAFVGKDLSYSFYNAYLPSDIPFIAIYNKKKELIRIYKGETDINLIICQ